MIPADLIEPAGELTAEMFPNRDVNVFAQAWLDEAEARTTATAAQAAWVYYRAFSHVADRLNAGLASDRKGDAAASLAASQFTYWLDRANAKLAEYHALTTGPAGPILTRWT